MICLGLWAPIVYQGNCSQCKAPLPVNVDYAVTVVLKPDGNVSAYLCRRCYTIDQPMGIPK